MLRLWTMLGAFLVSMTAASAETIPFRYVHGEILVDARIGNSGPHTFILDTGTTLSTISSDLSRRLNLALRMADVTVNDVAGRRIDAVPVFLSDVVVGDLRLQRLDAVALDVGNLRQSLAVSVDGILGSNFFEHRIVQIDYPCRLITILRRMPAGKPVVHFARSADGYIVSHDIWLGGRHASAIFDTGNSGGVVVTEKGIDDLHLERSARFGYPVVSYGSNGAVTGTEGILYGLRIGGIPLPDTTARFLPASRESFDLNVGNGVLDQFVATFDYASGSRMLEPPRSCATAH